jgi:hypothetical protein
LTFARSSIRRRRVSNLLGSSTLVSPPFRTGPASQFRELKLHRQLSTLSSEVAVARKAIVLSVCCGAFFTASLACNAQTFGDVRAVNQTRNLTQGAQDPAISKWLMTLPADEDSAERTHAGLSGEMLDDNPIGGELHDPITPPRPDESVERFPAAGSAVRLDPDPIGGEVYHLSRGTKLTGRPTRDVTARIPRRESDIAVGQRLRGRTLGSRARGINRPAVTTTRTRVSSRPSAALRTRAALTRAPTPAPAITVQTGYAYDRQPWGWGYPQPPATGGPVTRLSVSPKTARPAVITAPAQPTYQPW